MKLIEFLNIAEATKFFDDLCKKHEVECSAPQTTARLLDKVCKQSIEVLFHPLMTTVRSMK